MVPSWRLERKGCWSRHVIDGRGVGDVDAYEWPHEETLGLGPKQPKDWGNLGEGVSRRESTPPPRRPTQVIHPIGMCDSPPWMMDADCPSKRPEFLFPYIFLKPYNIIFKILKINCCYKKLLITVMVRRKSEKMIIIE